MYVENNKNQLERIKAQILRSFGDKKAANASNLANICTGLLRADYAHSQAFNKHKRARKQKKKRLKEKEQKTRLSIEEKF